MDAGALPDMLLLHHGWLGSLWQITVGVLISAFGIHAVRRPGLISRFERPFWNRTVAWFLAAMGFAFTVLSVLRAVPSGNGLTLTREGFTERSLWRSSRLRWDQVLSPFEVVPRDNPDDWVRDWVWPATVIRYRIPPPPGSAPPCCIMTFDGFWGHANVDLARTLNAWRERARAAQPEKQQ